jgi:Delta24(24(1))-sterol reductase
VVNTWDIVNERFGFMLVYWNAAGIPFGYSAPSMYLLLHGPVHNPVWYTCLCYGLLFFGYYIFDCSNCQKAVFKAMEAGTWDPTLWRAPPQLPGAWIENPKTIGGRLLYDGWWRYARKISYTSDMMMSLASGLVSGFSSILPYWVRYNSL